MHSRALISAGFHLGLAYQRHWCGMRVRRVFLLPSRSMSGGVSRNGCIFSFSFWLQFPPGCCDLCSPTPDRQSPLCCGLCQLAPALGPGNPPLASCCHWSLSCFLILSLSSQLFYHSCKKKFPLWNLLYLKYLERFLFSSILFSATVNIFQFLG